MEAQTVFAQVRICWVCIMYSAMAQVFSRRHLTSEIRVHSREIPYEFCSRQIGTGTGLSSSVTTIAPMLHIHLRLNTTFTKKKLRSFGYWGVVDCLGCVQIRESF